MESWTHYSRSAVILDIKTRADNISFTFNRELKNTVTTLAIAIKDSEGVEAIGMSVGL